MRFSDDEHVEFYGRRANQKTDSKLLLKSFTGIYGHLDELGGHGLAQEFPDTMPYPCVAVERLVSVFKDEQWEVDTLKINHVQLVGKRCDFHKLAGCISTCQTLKTVIFGDSKTSLRSNESTVSGFDALIGAMRLSPSLADVSLQNMDEISGEALGELCQSTSIEKLQIFLSPSLLPADGISRDYLQNVAQKLHTNQTMKELRIIGVLGDDACRAFSDMLLVNKTLEKIAVKIKVKPATEGDDPLPLFEALRSPCCSLSSLEIYLSGCRKDLEDCSDAFRDALQSNQSLKQLNLTFYGMDLHGRGGLATLHTNAVWMKSMEDALEQNYVLRQVMLNHSLLELSKKVKLYLRLNRAGRKILLETGNNYQAKDSRSSELNQWVDTLAKVKDDLSCLYYIISCAPTMFCPIQETRMLSAALATEGVILPLKRRRLAPVAL